MNHLYTFKSKVLLLGFASLAFCCALTGIVKLFAGAQDTAKKSRLDSIPVVVLSDGKNKKIMMIDDFFKATSSNPNLTADDISKVVRLKNELELGKAQIDLFKKLTEKKEEPFFIGAVKSGKSDALSMMKSVIRPIISGVTTAVIIGGVAVTVLWYLGWFNGEYKGTSPTPLDYNIEPSLTNPENMVEVLKDYAYTNPAGVPVNYGKQLCGDHGLLYNLLLRPGDCPNK